MMLEEKNIIQVEGLCTAFGAQQVHNNINLTVRPREIIALIGGSGCGKTTLLRTLLMLHRPQSGQIKVFGVDVWHCTAKEAQSVQKRWGVMFQSSALFSSCTVIENVLFPLREAVKMTSEVEQDIGLLKLSMVGLQSTDAKKYPSELSGGMKKRAALARALVMDPDLVFLDEPSSGLDPQSAEELDSLILHLRDHLGLTVVMITHDLDTLWRVPDRVVFLGDGQILADDSMERVVDTPHPLIQSYFAGIRGQINRRMVGVEEGRDGH